MRETQAKLSLKNKQVRQSTEFEKEGCENRRQPGWSTFGECVCGDVDLTAGDEGESTEWGSHLPAPGTEYFVSAAMRQMGDFEIEMCLVG